MPFNTIAEFEKSFPAIKNLDAKQKRAALQIFNKALESGDNEGSAIKKAIGSAKRIEAAVHRKEDKLSEVRRVLSLAELDFQVDEEFDDMALTQKKFEILKVGEFFDQRYGKFKVTEERLLALKKNFDENVLDIDVALDLNHDPTNGAFAWISTLTVEGGKLLMTLKDITSEGRKILKEKVFKYFSVEFAPFETVIDGKKATINDVLRGVALTNRPVIKGMQPTFLSEETTNSLNSTKTMSLIMKLAESMLTRGKELTKADASFLRGQLDEAEEAEKTEEVEEKVAEVEAKAEEVEAAADEAKDEDPKPPAEDKKSEAGDAEPDAVQASEMTARFAEQDKKLSDQANWIAGRVADDRVASLTLSETNKIGFASASATSLRGFIATLSESQFKAFSELTKKVVDATKLGEEFGKAGDGAKSDSEDAKLAEAAKLSEQYQKDGLAPDVAMRKAQKAAGLTG